MELKKVKIKTAIQSLLKEKGKRKFVQSVELIINFRGVDFTKQENRVNLELVLPNGKGKPSKVVVIASDSVINEIRKTHKEITTMTLVEIESISESDMKKLAKDHYFFVEPKLIGIVAKKWGKVLGPRGKAPRPFIGKPDVAIDKITRTVRMQNRGKFVPTLQTVVGSESMDPDLLLENVESVFETLTKKISQGNLKNAYLKLTMGKPIEI